MAQDRAETITYMVQRYSKSNIIVPYPCDFCKRKAQGIFAPFFKKGALIMAKAKKLKSGNWRVLVYEFTDENKNGTTNRLPLRQKKNLIIQYIFIVI